MINFLIGSQRNKPNQSMDLLSLDGNNEKVVSLDAGINPTFFAVSKDKKFIYTVNELNQATHGEYGKIVCLKKENDRYQKVSELSTGGDDPCHVLLDEKRNFLFVTNYSSGSLSVFLLKTDNKKIMEVKSTKLIQKNNEEEPNQRGYLDSLIQKIQFQGSSIHPERQQRAHAHQSILDPQKKRLLVSDLGSDKIYIYDINNEGKEYSSFSYNALTLVYTEKCVSGNGPRHMVFDEDNYLYVLGELSSSVSVYRYLERSGELVFLSEYHAFIKSETPIYPMNSAAEIALFSKYLYTSNRGDDSISVFECLGHGKLKHIHNVGCGGHIPRNFRIIDNALWDGVGTMVVSNQESGDLVFFSIEGSKLVKQKKIAIKKPMMLSELR